LQKAYGGEAKLQLKRLAGVFLNSDLNHKISIKKEVQKSEAKILTPNFGLPEFHHSKSG
jgi:hypothetical protein